MNLRKKLLYSGYLALKRLQYVKMVNAFSNHADILTFHRVNDYDSNPLTTTVATFEETVHELKINYNVISLTALIRKIRNKEAFDSKSVVITFDDGYRDNFLYAAPVLKKWNFPATFFVTSEYINTKRIFPWDTENDKMHPVMSWDEVKELSNAGFDVGAHTANHVDLGRVPLEVARKEVMCSKEEIESQINKRISTFSFPFGRPECIRDDVKLIIKEAGFDCCCSMYGGKVGLNSDPYNLPRIGMYPNTTELLMELDNFMTYLDGKMKINLFGRESMV